MKKISSKNKKILAACIFVFLAVTVTLVSTLAVHHSNGPAKVTKTYFKALNERDLEAFCSCMMPSQQKSIRIRAEQLGGEKAYFDQVFYDSFKNDELSNQFGADIKLIVSDIKTEKQDIIDNMYHGIDMKALKATAASIVDCQVTTKGTLGETTEPVRLVCFKIEGKWHIYTMSPVPEDPAATPTDTK